MKPATVILFFTLFSLSSSNGQTKGVIKSIETNTYYIEVPTADSVTISPGDYVINFENGLDTFDRNGKIISSVKYFRSEGDFDRRIIYEYTTDGVLISLRVFDKQFNLVRSEIADTGGRFVLGIKDGHKIYERKFKFNPNGMIGETIMFTYDKDGKVYLEQIEKEEYFKNGYSRKKHEVNYIDYYSDDLLGIATYEYDTLGRVINFTAIGQTEFEAGTSKYKYNSAFHNDYTGEYYVDKVLKNRRLVKCDSHDNIISETSTDFTKNETTTKQYRYEYDVNGNWLKKTISEDGGTLGHSKEVIYRTIKY